MGIDIPHTLAVLKGLYDAAMLARSAEKEWNVAEWKFKAAEVAEATFQARMTIVDLQSTLEERDKEIASLKAQAAEGAAWTFEAPFYWREADSGRDGPFCQRCRDVDGKSVRLMDAGRGRWRCAGCNTVFDGPERAKFVAQETAAIRRRNSQGGFTRDW